MTEPAAVASPRAHVAVVVARMRWAGVVLGLAQSFMTTDPRLVGGWAAGAAAAAVMAAYNVPASLAERFPPRRLEVLCLATLAGDFAVCTAWMLLTSNDVFSTSYTSFSLVAVEAAALYGTRGTLGFIAAFLAASATYYAVRLAAFDYPPLLGSVVFRCGIIVVTAVFIGAIAESSERRRAGLAASAASNAQLVDEISQHAQRFASLLDAISDVGEGLLITDGGRLVYGNHAYELLTGYTQKELAALPSLIDLAPPGQRDGLRERLLLRLSGATAPFRYESQLITKDGRVRDIETGIRTLPAEGSTRLIAVVRDITDRKSEQTRLEASERQALISARSDALTGIANRRAWDEEIDRAIRRARRESTPLSVALIDVDDFKEYNDDWGHQRGDRLLRDYTATWSDAMRDVDLLARYGGDEFAVLLPGAGVDEARHIIDRLRAATPPQPSFSAGIARWDGAETAEALMGRADAALYDSKRSGRGCVTALATDLDPSQGWAYRLPRLLGDRDVAAVYQVIRRLDGGAVLGYEALARPSGSTRRGGVDGLFAAAKRLGMSRDLDWLCRRAAIEGAAGFPESALLFVNVSVHALLDPLHDVDQMLLLLRHVHRAPESVVLEITERDRVSDLARLRAVLSDYREVGFRFALDDVGEGHSTLEVLALANPEFVKVARSLSVGAVSPGPRAAIEALVTFCSTSSAAIIAEGLETDAHVGLMRDLGVTHGQGYALGEPRRAEELRAPVLRVVQSSGRPRPAAGTGG